jgi:predicted lysophospholipase L1 biosynthesis ABC-type transport system permease subunit
LPSEKIEIPINVYNYVLANIRRHKLRYGLTIFGMIVCIVFFIIIASLSIGLYEPTEPEIPTQSQTPEDEVITEDVIELDNNVKRTIVNWLYLTSVLIFATAVAGVSNTMLMSMIERKREIGILKSVGLRNREILEIFFAESFTICLIAFAIGSLVGLHFANNIFNYLDSENINNVFFATMRTPPVVIFAAFIIVFVVGILAGLLPAYRAVKLTPVDALKG